MNFRPLVKPVVLIGVSVALGYLIFAPLWSRVIDIDYRSDCLSNLKQMSLAYQQYVRDFDGASPPVSRQNQGWADLLQPYAKSWKVFECPAGRNASQTRRTDYFYNARLANVRQVPFPDQTILFGDGYDNSGANANLTELPFDWKDEDSPERRHPAGFDVVFVNGFVKTCRPQDIANKMPSGESSDWKPTLAVR